jgi:Tfp pilus tip-associated adhesin PilY1
MWSFPDYGSFDPDITAVIGVSDGFPGGAVRIFGDLKGTATDAEKRVGFTFSDPAVGPLTLDRSVNAVIVGSGYFPAIETHADLARGPGAPAAGRTVFVLEAATGRPIGGGGSCSGAGCLDVGDIANGIKNAVQADVTATGEFGSPVVTKAYAGDLDGRYSRFDVESDGSISRTILAGTGQPIYSSSALLSIGSSQRYLFFSTGSDLLAHTTPGGAGTFRLFGLQDSTAAGVPGSITFTENLGSVSPGSNLLTNGERPTSAPTVAGDIVFFTTTADFGSASCDEVTANLYAFTFLGTGAYDANGNGTLESNESPIVMTTPGRATAPFIADQHLFIGVTSMTGTGVTLLGDPADFNNGVGQVGLRVLSWREIR